MATQGERRALFFLAAVALLGAGTRAWRSRRVGVDTAGLAGQLQAIDGLADRRIGRSRRQPSSFGRSGDPSIGRSANPSIGRSANPPIGRSANPQIDIDVASPDELQRLPGIGPALAQRIVKDRDTKGPFGCLAALDRVKGIGPALLARIDSLSTFSAAGGAPCASPGRPPSR